jgi:hypothetical protein
MQLSLLFDQEPDRCPADVIQQDTEAIEWSEHAIQQLMDSMLVHSVKTIRNKDANTMSCAEEIRWLFCEDPTPFSAVNCALVSGLSLLALRAGVYRSVNEEKKTVIRLTGFRLFDNEPAQGAPSLWLPAMSA